jgi:hypothetical protein
MMPKENTREDNSESKRKGGGGRLSRSETVTVRLDPKLRYLAELAARKQRRTLSSFIEWAVEESLTHIVLYEGEDYPGGPDVRVTVADKDSSLWDVVEADRFAKLALRYPDLLSYEEQVLWKIIKENGFVWRGTFQKEPPYAFTWLTTETHLHFKRLREYWANFVAVASGEAEESTLPKWKEVGTPSAPPPPPPRSKVDDLEDEIPF